MTSVLVLLSLVLAGTTAKAMSLDWTGGYRAEYIEVDKTSLASPALRKSYLLNHLHLSPKIIAADGINIVARFDVLTNPYYTDSQVGQQFGSGSNKAVTNPPSSGTQDSSVAGNTAKTSYLQVSELYMTINQEYGAVLVGRAPMQFGLGISHNAGNGVFDHWFDVEDVIAYKFVIGNLSFTPMVGRVYDASVAQGKDVQDIIWNIEYNNPETESVFGLWHQTRTSSTQSNDAPAVAYGGTGSTIINGWNTQDVNIYIARGFEAAKFRLEAGFRSGTTGVSTAAGEEVKVNGYGIALEVDLPKKEGRTDWQIRTGVASGDNPSTAGTYEGFHFDRNYDIAFLLFNHPLGSYDLFRTGVQRNRAPTCTPSASSPCAVAATDESVDEEVVSNTYYFSPRFVYSVNEKWDWTGTFTYAQLATDPLGSSAGTAKDVGYELDSGFVFKPSARVQWVNELGFLFPGGAFKGSSASPFTAGFTFGFQSKAAISF